MVANWRSKETTGQIGSNKNLPGRQSVLRRGLRSGLTTINRFPQATSYPAQKGAIMSDPAEKSPLTIFREYCNRGELAYQTADNKPFFYPRLAAPGTGSTDLEWEVSSGLGTVYATTTLFPRGADPYDVSLIDLDEGFRMMSRVEGIDPLEVQVGMRVKVRMVPGTDDEAPYPVFDVAEDA